MSDNEPIRHPANRSAIFMGNESLLTECAEQWLGAGNSIKLISSADTHVEKWAARNQISCVSPDMMDHASQKIEFDVLFGIINFRLLSAALLSRPKIAAINFHDGPLPQYGGRNVTMWALLNNEDRHSISWHLMAPEARAGKVCVQQEVPINEEDTSFTLNLNCFKAGLDSFPRVMDFIDTSRIFADESSGEFPSLYLSTQRPKDACILNFQRSNDEIARVIRALNFGFTKNPVGVAKILHDGKWLGVGSGLTEKSQGVYAGQVVEVSDEQLLVGCGDNSIALSGFMAPNGTTLSAKEALDYFDLNVGESFEELDDELLLRVKSDLEARARDEAHWKFVLENLQPLVLPISAPTIDNGGYTEVDLAFTHRLTSECEPFESYWVNRWLTFLVRFSGQSEFHIRYKHKTIVQNLYPSDALFDLAPPVNITIDSDKTCDDICHIISSQIADGLAHGVYASDLPLRVGIAGNSPPPEVNVAIVIDQDAAALADLCFVVSTERRQCKLIADTAKVSSNDLKCLVGSFKAYCEGLSDNLPIAETSLLTQRQTNRLIDLAGGGPLEFPRSKLVHELFLDQAKRSPNATAVVINDSRLTYKELARRTELLSSRLSLAGVGANDLVGIHLDRGIDLIVAMLSILRAGAGYISLDPSFPTDRLRYMIDDSKMVAVIASEAQQLSLDLSDIRVLFVEQVERESIYAEAESAKTTAKDIAYVMYTSGSTGRPKGVVVPHECVVNFLSSMCKTPGLDKRDRLVAVSTTSFDISVLEIFGPLSVGGCIILADTETTLDAAKLRALIESSDANVMQATPATWRMLIQAGWTGDPDFRIWCGGEALAADLASELTNRSDYVWNMYGPTETTVWSSCKRLAPDEKYISIGTAIDNTELYILNDKLSLQPPGVPGELCIGGVGVTQGYLNRPELTAEKFVTNRLTNDAGNRLYRTGDLARLLPNGEIEHLGRLDNQIKIRGYRIELGEIEHELNSVDAISQSVVTVWTVAPGDDRLVAHVIPSTRQAPSSVAIRKHLRRNLPEYMIPQYFESLDQFPLTANGKINRRALLPPNRQIDDEIFAPPQSEMELELAGIWMDLLLTESIGRDANFFESGGHSLLAVKAVQRMEDQLSIKIELRWLVNESLQTIAEYCARKLEEKRPSSLYENRFRRLINSILKT